MPTELDTIFVHNLRVDAVIGVYDWEKEFKQPLFFDIEMLTDIRASAAKDDINLTVSYKEVSDDVIDWVETHQFELLETLAEQLSHILLAKYQGIQQITLTVKKPQAVRQAETVGLKITRRRA
jgi:7,8-dihydroneopterin aldolase/epimerase/oxygenase